MEIPEQHPQSVKANAFKALHQRPGIFVMPNAWEAGSAKILTSLGFEAIASTSAGLAYSMGKTDGESKITREDTIYNASAIVNATRLPVSADLENGYNDDPESCAHTILLAARAGLVGGSIEDATGKPEDPILPFALSVERIKIAVKAARSLSFPFILTARAENLIYGRPDLNDTISRLQAFADAGADVVFAPGLRTREEVQMVVKAVAPCPVNVVIGSGQEGFTVKILEDLGVKRISLGSSLVRAAYTGLMKASEEIKLKGSFSFTDSTISYSVFNDLFK